jgi:hypothetical protein
MSPKGAVITTNPSSDQKCGGRSAMSNHTLYPRVCSLVLMAGDQGKAM